MSTKKLYYKKTTQESAYVEVEGDYTQVYDNFCKLSRDINNGMSYKLLFWLLSHRINKDRGLAINNNTLSDFNKFLAEKCDHCDITAQTLNRCVKELTAAGALTRVTRGFYYANAYCLWKGSVRSRDKFLEDEANHKDYIMLNPGSSKALEP